jgi:hypothetical protein
MRRRLALELLGFVANAAMLPLTPAFASAQRPLGTIRDQTSRQPVAGAVVSFVDSTGRFLSRTISDSAGHFVVQHFDQPARLTVLRIGYRPLELPVGDTDSAIVVLMQPIPAALATVTARSRRVCPGDRDGGQALELWEQARAALLASWLARELSVSRIGLISYTRTLDPINKHVEDETRESKFVVGDRPYVSARPAWALARDGYMREDVGGERTYFAPDESVMLDESFAATHCLYAMNGTGQHGTDVGIGFEPIIDDARDTLVDVRGTLWIDHDIRALRSLDFEYTGLERIANGTRGQLIFRVMPNGAPMIQR